MGNPVSELFDDEDVVLTNASTSPIFPINTGSDEIPVGSQGVQYAVYNNQDIAAKIVQEYLSSYGVRLDNFYTFAEQFHPYGLPQSGALNLTNNRVYDVDEDDLVAEYYGVNPSAFRFQPRIQAVATLSNEYALILKFQNEGGYNAYTGEVDIAQCQSAFGILLDIPTAEIPNYQVKLKGIGSGLINNATIDLIYQQTGAGSTFKNYEISLVLVKTYIPSGTVVEETYDFTIDTLSKPRSLIFSWFNTGENPTVGTVGRVLVYPDDPDERNFELSDGIATLENEFATTAPYPIVPLVVDGQAINAEYGEQGPAQQVLYESSKALAQRIRVDTDALLDEIEKNPDRDKLTGATIYMGVDLNGGALELEYVFRYFKQVFDDTGGNSSASGQRYTNALNEETGLVDFYTAVTWADLNVIEHSGVMPFSPNARKTVGTQGETGAFRITVERHPTYDGNKPSEKNEDNYFYILSKQTSPTTWTEIKVGRLGMATRAYYYRGEFYGAGYGPNRIREGFSQLRLPLDKNLLDTFNQNEQAVISRAAACIMFTSGVVETLEFYERPEFGAALQILGLVVSIVTFDFSGGTYEIIKQIVIKYAITQLTIEVFEYIADKVGGDLGVITATVAVIATLYFTADLTGFDQLNFAEQAITATNAVSTASQAFTAEQMDDLLDSINAFNAEADVVLNRLQEAQEDLTIPPPNGYLLGIIDNVFADLESPNQFYRRTIHTGNPGVQALSKPTNFVANALQLPDLIRETDRLQDLTLFE